MNAISSNKKLLIQSDLRVTGKGTDLLIALCEKLNVQEYLAFKAAEKYLDQELFTQNGITLKLIDFNPPIYPQLWGDFIYNLSTLDLLLNCGGEKSSEIISGS